MCIPVMLDGVADVQYFGRRGVGVGIPGFLAQVASYYRASTTRLGISYEWGALTSRPILLKVQGFMLVWHAI